MSYENFVNKYRENPNSINHQLLEKARSVAPIDDISGSAREELDTDRQMGYSSVYNNSQESVIVRSDTLNKVVMYRDIARYPEVSNVIDQITNDCIIFEKGDVATLNLDKTNFSEAVKKKITLEFENILRIIGVNEHLTRYFRDWYVDSKLFFENVYEDGDINNKIIEMRKLDPVSVVPRIVDEYELDDEGNKIYVKNRLYYEYNNNMSQFTSPQQQATYGSGGLYGNNKSIILEEDQITYSHSGIVDCKGRIKGHLHQAIKPAHTLKMIENAIIIYRMTHSPDRKIFYIDTGTLPPAKAEEFMKKVMNANTKRFSFDSETGKLNTSNGMPLMGDDYYLQRSNGLTITDVDTLSGATGMNELDDLRWHNKKLFEALKVPLSRMPNENVVMFGDDGGTSRDEINFQKLIEFFRKNFAQIFLIPLRINLIRSGIIEEDDWEFNKEFIFVQYIENEYFKERARLELLKNRAETADSLFPLIGKIFSYNWVAKEIFGMTGDEIDEQRKIIKDEMKDEALYPPEIDDFGGSNNFSVSTSSPKQPN